MSEAINIHKENSNSCHIDKTVVVLTGPEPEGANE